MKMRLVLSTIGIMGFLAACDQNQKKIPDGYELMGSQGVYHFVYVSDPEQYDNRRGQREAGMVICEMYSPDQDCQVFFWKNRDEVVTKLPIVHTSTPIGNFTIKDKRINQKVLK